MNRHVDILAIAAHRDDADLTGGGTLAKAVKSGHPRGIPQPTQVLDGTRRDGAPGPGGWISPAALTPSNCDA